MKLSIESERMLQGCSAGCTICLTAAAEENEHKIIDFVETKHKTREGRSRQPKTSSGN